MFGASAALGPLCDGLHSAADVLHYERPTLLLRLGESADGGGAPLWALETCWWVPLLFGVAGVIIGVGVPVLDEVLAARGASGGTKAGRTAAAAAPAVAPPSWPAVLLCIALFVIQYWTSGQLQAALWAGGDNGLSLSSGGGGGSTWPLEDAALLVWALAMWGALDATPQGAFMAALTAACGPAVEIALINGLHLYHYTAPQLLGVPTWIPWVYAAGGPAVGGLGRRVWAELKARRQRQQQQQRG